MINNFEQIKTMFNFNEKDNRFLHCQIVQRTKDLNGERVHKGAIKTYFLRSAKQLMDIRDEIIFLCEHYKARAYITVSGKDFKSLQSLVLVKLADDIHQGLIRNPEKCLNSAVGELKPKIPKWIVDVDDISMKDSIKETLMELYISTLKKDNFGVTMKTLKKIAENYIYTEIPTRQGVHLIVRPFNTKTFEESFPNVDVHKNSMGTLLYYPNSLNNPSICCSECGSTDIEVQAWVDANTDEYISDVESDNTCWCRNCHSMTTYEDIKSENEEHT